MSELNREKAIDILEKFDFFQGQRAGRELWSKKPYNVQEQDLRDFAQNVTLLIDYIKELTEENARLSEDNEIKSQKRANIFEIISAFERGRTDGVRKMQERLIKEKTTAFGSKCEVIPLYVIDQIAKEMLEKSE